MKKRIILMALVSSLMITGCSKDEKTKEEVTTSVVYCDSCGEESNEVTKFCSDCGEEAKWLAEKPVIEGEEESVPEVTPEEEQNEEDVDFTLAESDNIEEYTEEVIQHSYHAEYINKLNAVEEGMSDLDYLYENGVTSEMNEAEATKLGRWDDVLNKVDPLSRTLKKEGH